MKSQSSQEDTQLMLKFCEGDENAFSRLMEQNLSRVVNTIHRFLGRANDAEDIAQEVFLRIYNARDRYLPTARFNTWLYRIIANLCLNYIRDHRHAQSVQFQKTSSQSIEIKDDSQETPSKIVAREEIRNQVRLALQTLPPNQRIVMVLAKYEGLSYQEIAEAMNTTPQAVKSLLNRAKNSLKERLQQTKIGRASCRERV